MQVFRPDPTGFIKKRVLAPIHNLPPAGSEECGPFEDGYDRALIDVVMSALQ